MSLWRIAWRSIQQRSLSSFLTGLSMALGVSLVVAVLVVLSVVSDSFRSSAGLGYNMVIGPKGSSLDLVLNTVYYLRRPIGNIPYSYYQEFETGEFKKYAQVAVPVCLGDYFGDFRVIGTTPEFFTSLMRDRGNLKFASGKSFTSDWNQANVFSGVVGATVAKEMRVKVGDEFQPSHSAPGEQGHKHDPFKIVGVLEPTGTPIDRAVYINIEGFYLLDDHAKPVPKKVAHTHTHADGTVHTHDEHDEGEEAGHDDHDHDEHAGHDHAGHVHHHHFDKPLPVEQRELTAILVLTDENGFFGPILAKQVNGGLIAQAAMPVLEISSLFEVFVQPIQWLLVGLAIMVIIVAGIGILVSIYNSMSERRREIAVLRALGANRGTVMRIVLLESILLSLVGGAAGWLLGHAIVGALGPKIAGITGVNVGFWQCAMFTVRISNTKVLLMPYEAIIIPGLVILAAVVGFLPAAVAYRTDVGKSLAANP